MEINQNGAAVSNMVHREAVEHSGISDQRLRAPVARSFGLQNGPSKRSRSREIC